MKRGNAYQVFPQTALDSSLAIPTKNTHRAEVNSLYRNEQKLKTNFVYRNIPIKDGGCFWSPPSPRLVEITLEVYIMK